MKKLLLVPLGILLLSACTTDSPYAEPGSNNASVMSVGVSSPTPEVPTSETETVPEGTTP